MAINCQGLAFVAVQIPVMKISCVTKHKSEAVFFAKYTAPRDVGHE